MKVFALLVFAAVTCTTQGAPSPQIVGGKDAPVGKYPYQVGIRLFGDHWCGGSIIDNRNILTAAHCLKGRENMRQYFTVHAGTNFLNESGSAHDIASMTLHANYNSNNFHNDIALLHLSTPIKYTNRIQPIKLSSNDAGTEGKPCKLTGWGDLWAGGRTPNNLQEIDLIIYPQANCKQIHRQLGDNQICTYTKSGEGGCNGDSGGPLVANGIQVGVVSYGVPCGVGYPDVYTRVSVLLPWINANLKK